MLTTLEPDEVSALLELWHEIFTHFVEEANQDPAEIPEEVKKLNHEIHKLRSPPRIENSNLSSRGGVKNGRY